jgi:hypothetical protein
MVQPFDPGREPGVASFLYEVMRFPVARAWLDTVAPAGGSLNVFADASREREAGGHVAVGCFALDDRHAVEFERAMVAEKARLGLQGREVKFEKRSKIGADRIAALLRRAAEFPSTLMLWVRRLDDEHGRRYRRDAAQVPAPRSKNAVLVSVLFAESMIGTVALLANSQFSIALWPDRNSFPDNDDELVQRTLGFAGNTIGKLTKTPPRNLFLPNARSIARDQGHDSLFEIGRSIADLAAGTMARHYTQTIAANDEASQAVLATLADTAFVDDPVPQTPHMVHIGHRICAVPDRPGFEILKRFSFTRRTGVVASATT